MFFAIPKVKSLSRYSEYGIYLSHGYFLGMLLLAILMHVSIIVIYSMTPHQKVLRIPVHALNIKLSGGSSANGIHMPEPNSAAPAPSPATSEKETTPSLEVEMKPVTPENAESVLDSAFKPDKTTAHASKTIIVPGGTGKVARKRDDHSRNGEASLATPKKYVREASSANSKNHTPGGDVKNNSDGVKGDPGGKEAINRYTQTVSQWIKNHQSYARAAYKEAAQSQNKLAGQTVIRLRISRDGHIIYSSVDRTSGNELVDEIAIAMVRASDPVPPVPGDYPSDSQLEFLIAVQVDFSKQ